MQTESLKLLETSRFALRLQADEMSILLFNFNGNWSEPKKFINISKFKMYANTLLVTSYV
jgi:hypothetical protein